MSTNNQHHIPSTIGQRSQWQVLWQKACNLAPIYLLLLPTLLGMAVLSYWPKLDVFRYAFFRWIPEAVEDFTGLANFVDAFHDVRFHAAFSLVFLLLAANLVKMLPSIIAAILIHRLDSGRWRYFFQICFVVPMVIPALVWLLLWKGFMDPNVGLINALLNATGLMEVLAWLDMHMYRLADLLYPVGYLCDVVFTGTIDKFLLTSPAAEAARPTGMGLWGLALFGVVITILNKGWQGVRERLLLAVPVFLLCLVVWQEASIYLIPLALVVTHLVRKKSFDDRIAGENVFRAGAILVTTGVALLLLTKVWDHHIGTFHHGSPAWLGHSDLIVPSVIFWGFPWIHAVGVLIYLAGLQQISKDVYEAADLDGVTSLGKIFHLELPLILTQVRINLIFLTINTLNSYGFFLILLGPTGGPGGKGTVPGLYMYQVAFINSRYGYACALGLIMFAIILALTIIYQRHVKVDK